MRPKLRGLKRPALLHILPDLKISTRYQFLRSCITAFDNYTHKVVVLDDPVNNDSHTDITLKALGADVFYTDTLSLTETELAEKCDSCILYDLADYRLALPAELPRIQYACTKAKYDTKADSVIACSDYMAKALKMLGGLPKTMVDDMLVAYPGVDWRKMHMYALPKEHKNLFTVSLASGENYNKYPLDIANLLIDKLPKDFRLVMSNHKKLELNGREVHKFPVQLDASIRVIQYGSVVVYARNDDYNSYTIRTCIEACSMGRPVVCKNTGLAKALFTDGVNALLFNNEEELIDKIMTVHKDPEYGMELGHNAKTLVAEYDIVNALHTMKSEIHALGNQRVWEN